MLNLDTIIKEEKRLAIDRVFEGIFDADEDSLDNEIIADWIKNNNAGRIRKINVSSDGVEGEGSIILRNIKDVIELNILSWKGSITFIDCDNLTSLEGIFADGAKVESFTINGAKNLTSLEGLPEEIDSLELYDLPILKDFSNHVRKVGRVEVMKVGKKRVKLSKLQQAFPSATEFAGYAGYEA